MSQILRPDSDITTGDSAWTPSTGTTRYGVIDEASYSDTDYISTTSRNMEQICGLSNPSATPGAGGGTLRWRGKAGSTGKTITPSILQGTTVIKAGSAVTVTTSFAGYTLTLSEAEMASITDWTNLRVRVVSGNQTGTTFYVSWAEFEVPDPAPSAGLEMGVLF